ncbi:MAG TPA: TolC family protein [Candidatus Eisenbacteria bacterium]|jgi:outer membrane protein TolC
MSRFPAVLVAAVVVLAGGPRPARSMDLESTLGEVPAASADTASLDLEHLLRRVLERNPTLTAARAAWSEAGARARQAGALEDPMLEVMGAPRSFGSSSVAAGYRVGVTQALPLFGQRGLRRRIGEAEARAAAWDLRMAQLDLAHQTRIAFLNYWRVGRALALNRELRDLLPEFRRISLAKYSAGLVGQQDPLQVDTELAMLDHDAVILDRERRVVVATLNTLMHEPAEGWLPPPPNDLSLPDTIVVHADLAPRARALRPEMRAVDARVEASRAEVALAGRQGLPETSFGVAYDRFWSEPELRTTVGMTMNLPIHLGRLSATRAEAQARLAASESQREVVRDSIELQVAVAAARLHEQAHDVQIARERLLPLAERTLRAARASYEANRTDFLTVLNSLRDFLRARLEADESLAMLHEARADLDRALGELPSALEKEKMP